MVSSILTIKDGELIRSFASPIRDGSFLILNKENKYSDIKIIGLYKDNTSSFYNVVPKQIKALAEIYQLTFQPIKGLSKIRYNPNNNTVEAYLGRKIFKAEGRIAKEIYKELERIKWNCKALPIT